MGRAGFHQLGQGRREDVGAGGVSRSKRLACAVVVCTRGSMRVSELAAEADILPPDRAEISN
jgi:hypothetical protein